MVRKDIINVIGSKKTLYGSMAVFMEVNVNICYGYLQRIYCHTAIIYYRTKITKRENTHIMIINMQKQEITY